MIPDHSALIERLEGAANGVVSMKTDRGDYGLLNEAAAALRDLTAGDVVVVPIEPTNAMLQALALAIRLVGLDNLDKVIVRRRDEGAARAGVNPNLKAKAQGEGG